MNWVDALRHDPEAWDDFCKMCLAQQEAAEQRLEAALPVSSPQALMALGEKRAYQQFRNFLEATVREEEAHREFLETQTD